MGVLGRLLWFCSEERGRLVFVTFGDEGMGCLPLEDRLVRGELGQCDRIVDIKLMSYLTWARIL